VQIIRYPHPTLRHTSRPLRRVDGELRKIIREMFELMYAEKGIGLAANQVDLPYRFFIINVTADPEAKDEEYVFINPVITRRSGNAEGEEGCLSLPEIYAPVRRPEKITITAYNLAGEEVSYDLNGLYARAAQHEADHLDGVLFIDRLSPSSTLAIKDALESLERRFQGQRRKGLIPGDEEITTRLAQLESIRT
jgi:peptide deformylase